MVGYCDMKTNEVIPEDEAFGYAVEEVLRGSPGSLAHYIRQACDCNYIMEESLQEMLDFIDNDPEGFVDWFYSGNYFIVPLD
jgi:hypothetical protein